LLFPRADLRGQRAKMPSPWLLETASLLAGERVYASEIDRFADQGWLDSRPSFESAVLGDGEPAHLQEFDTRSLRRWRLSEGEPGEHYLVRADFGFAAGFDLQEGRAQQGFTRWAGKVDASEGRSPFGGTPLSATALQEWAVCPFRYFAGRVLKVEEPDQDDDDLAISPLTKGSLIHEILDRFFAGAPRRTEPVQTWTDEDRALGQRVARDVFREAEEDGTVGHPFVWRTERERILADLDQFLDKDEKLRAEFGTVQTSSELAFGFEGAPELEVEVSDGKALKLRGRIDRIDEGEDGKVVVIDYKTGSVKPTAKALTQDPVVAGTYLQLPIYAAAVGGRPESSPVDSYYWFVTAKGKFARRGYAVGERQRERLREVLEVIGAGIEQGTFPQNPGDPDVQERDNCRNCPFDRLCPAPRRAAWRRARGDSALKNYVELAEYGASDD
jgi:ATP-dependent helicase/nuclease subunit B